MTEAKERLEELLEQAAAGEEVTIEMRDGSVALSSPVTRPRGHVSMAPDARQRFIEEMQERVAATGSHSGPCAAGSADFLYDEDGLPI